MFNLFYNLIVGYMLKITLYNIIFNIQYAYANIVLCLLYMLHLNESQLCDNIEH